MLVANGLIHGEYNADPPFLPLNRKYKRFRMAYGTLFTDNSSIRKPKSYIIVEYIFWMNELSKSNRYPYKSTINCTVLPLSPKSAPSSLFGPSKPVDDRGGYVRTYWMA